MDGWSNNSSYTSKSNDSGGWGNDGSSATSNGFGSSSSSSSSDRSYWSGVYGEKGSLGVANTQNPANQVGVYATKTAQQFLSEQIENKRATPEQITSAKAMIAGKNTVDGVNAVQGIANAVGAGFGLVGMAGSKALGWAAEKGVDYASGYKDNPSYNYAKQAAKDDSSLIGTAISMAAPSAVSPMANMMVKNNSGEFNQYANDLQKSMIKSGYSSAPKTQTTNSSSGGSSSLLKNMQTTQQAQSADSEINNNPLSLTYDNNFNFYSGTVM